MTCPPSTGTPPPQKKSEEKTPSPSLTSEIDHSSKVGIPPTELHLPTHNSGAHNVNPLFVPPPSSTSSTAMITPRFSASRATSTPRGSPFSNVELTSPREPSSSPSSTVSQPTQLSKCAVCRKLFPSSTRLEEHMYEHTEDWPYSCPVEYCTGGFLTEKELKTHQKNTHPSSKESIGAIISLPSSSPAKQLLPLPTPSSASSTPTVRMSKRDLKCKECGKHLSSPYGLTNHMYLHNNQWPFRCELCGKGATSKQHLAIHERIHTGEKPFSCDKCKKKFISKDVLSRHTCKPGKVNNWESRQGEIVILRYRSGEVARGKVKGCKIKCIENNCTSFTCSEASFRLHARVHLKNAPTCVTCEKRFPSKTSLKYHESIHTGEKSYSCDFCGKKFRRKSGYESFVSFSHHFLTFSKKYFKQIKSA
ncbi:MAG: C2H2-type zinc finger protein [Planctomycetes bacterium]|nr:C2H2-type zinc finger protein [Planctomycetota bacterium]